MAYAAAALPLCVMLEKLSHLEEEHDEHSLHELCPGSRKEADGECAQRGNGHEQVLVEHITVHDALGSLA